ncbi:MAG TPA: OmpA family protein, partial [Rhizomicrobium sp.]|nr:OmpA family protein [Rhizomicrobium sp.]
DAAGRQEVEAAAEAFRARGAGYIRVVGHASSREEAVSPERHLQLDFDHSQARATAVAMALIKAGVPADKVLVEAVGDSAPVRAVGTGNDRSAEIFIQG